MDMVPASSHGVIALSPEQNLKLSRQTPEIGSNATGEEAQAQAAKDETSFGEASGGSAAAAAIALPSAVEDPEGGGTTCKDDATDAEQEATLVPAFPRLPYRPEVDGLRAIAIIPVVLFHFECGFPGGFAGVDVFFVISGFLISCIVLHELAKGKFSMKNFWFRRVRRLFPALVCVLVPLFIAAWHLLIGATYSSMMEAITFTLAMGANILYFTRAKDYFQADHTEEPLLHCWSLAVEEQFYLVHPILLLILWRCTKSTKVVFAGLAALAIASFGMSVAYSTSNAVFAYYMLPTRAWEMAIGGILAFDHGTSIFDNRRWLAEVVSWGGVAMIIAACFVFTAATPWPSYHALLPCMGTLFFVWSQRPALTSCGKFFAHKVPVFVGQLSYSWYLWHWPVYVLLAYTSLTGHLRPGEKVAGLFGSFAIAVLSFKFVEPEFRRKDNWWANNMRFASVVAVVWMILITFSTVTWQKEVGGIRADMPAARADTPLFADRLVVTDAATGATCWEEVPPKAVNYSMLDTQTLLASRTWGDGGTGKFVADHSDAYFYMHPEDAEVPSIVVIGSSIAAMYAPALEQLATEYNRSIAFLVKSGAGGIFGMTEAEAEPGANEHKKMKGRAGYDGFINFVFHPEWDAHRLAHLERWKPDLVVWADAWEVQADLTTELMQSNFRSSLAAIAEHTENIVVIGSIPLAQGNFGAGVGIFNSLPKLVANIDRKYNGNFEALGMLPELLPDRRRRVEEELRTAIAAEVSERTSVAISFESISQYYLRNNASNYVKLVDPYSNQLAYTDQVHLNSDGVRVLEGVFRTSIFGELPCGGR